MELVSSTGTSLTLTIDGYQFPEITGAGDDDDITADSNWLLIRGRVQRSTAEWEFRDPCLLAAETEWLASWLREIASGQRMAAPVLEWDQEDPDLLSFTESNVSFSYESRNGDDVLIRVFLSHEALPAGETLEDVGFLDIATTAAALFVAADVWDEERRAFPARG